MSLKTLISGISAIIILVVISSFAFFNFNNKPAFHGETVTPPVRAADIHMPDQYGNDFQLSAQRGKVVLVFFGFLNCPEECPLTMAHLAQAMKTLGESSQDVEVVMVSTDPVRDTPQAMQNYLANFNPNFLGITGTAEQLQKIWSDYGVEVLDGGETHSAYTYVLDRKGNLRLLITSDTFADDIASDLKILLSE
jgi:protein SCO1/2